LARALAKRLGGRLVQGTVAPGRGECVVAHGDLASPEARADALEVAADEVILVDWICSESEAHREIFHRWVRRPRSLSERELGRYAAWQARAARIDDSEAPVVVRVGAGAPLSDQLLSVLAALRPRPERLAASPAGASVLVVDDDPDQRVILGEVLGELGCQVELAPDAAVALALLEIEPFDLVISDERMPGPSGVELAAAVARNHPSTRVVLLTAHADGDTVDRALGARARNVLAKPVSVVDLQRVLEELA
jgi:CheY-like chemotaxis protein